MDQQGVLIIRKLLYEEFPNQIADYKENINKSKIKKLKKLNIKTIYIFTTEPVDQDSFLSVINDYKNNDFDVKLKHLDTLDSSNFESITTILTDIYASFKQGGCLMVSYGKTFALPIICCFYISRGKKAEDALDNIKNLTNKAIEDDNELSFIYNFQHYFENNDIDFENIISKNVDDSTFSRTNQTESNTQIKPFFQEPVPEQQEAEKPFFQEPEPEKQEIIKPSFQESTPEPQETEKPFFQESSPEQQETEKPFFQEPVPEQQEAKKPFFQEPEPEGSFDEKSISDKSVNLDEPDIAPIIMNEIPDSDDIQIEEIGDSEITNTIKPLEKIDDYPEIKTKEKKDQAEPEKTEQRVPEKVQHFEEDDLETIDLTNDLINENNTGIDINDSISKLSEIQTEKKFEIESTQNDDDNKDSKIIISEITTEPEKKEKPSKKEKRKQAKIAKEKAKEEKIQSKVDKKNEKKRIKDEKKKAKLDKKDRKTKKKKAKEEIGMPLIVEPEIEKLDKKEIAEMDSTFQKVELGHFYSSIRFKMISIISMIIIVSLSGMIFWATRSFKQDIQINVKENNLKISEVIAQKVEAEIEKIRVLAAAMLKNVGADSNEDILFSGIATKRGNRIIITKSSYNDYLINKTKTDITTLNKLHNIYEKELTKTFEKDTIVQNISREMKFPAIALTFPLTQTRGGQVDSISILYIKLDTILKTFRPKGIIRSFMVNYKGDIIAHHKNSVVLTGGNYINLPIVDAMLKSTLNNGQKRYMHDDNKIHLGSFKKIDFGGGGIIAHVSEEKALQEVYNIQRRNFLIMIAVVATAILIVFFFGKTLTTPILRLVGATKLISEGEYDVKIRPTTKDEIGVLTSTFIEMGKGLEEREKIKAAFGKFVNEEIANAALKGELKLGGERKTIAIFFSDIRSFTAISENLEPEEVVEFLNQYMTIMVKCIEDTNGIVDKFIGDAIMAIWGTPISKGNDTENAINCALLMREKLLVFNKDRGSDKKPLINIGCGINTGPALAGQIGSEDRMEYTVIGDSVNLASRIEALNKPFGTDVLISEDSYQKVKDSFVVEKMQPIRVKGKVEPQNVYAVLGRKDNPNNINSVEELRQYLGIEMKTPIDKNKVADLDEGEKKYELLEE